VLVSVVIDIERIGDLTKNIVELALLFYVDKDGQLRRRDVSHPFRGHLLYTRCTKLRHTSGGQNSFNINIALLVTELVERGFLELGPTIRCARHLRVTKKGWRHIKKQDQRLRRCAEKVIYTDVLDRLRLAAS